MSEKRAQSVLAVHPSQTSVVMLQTGAVASQPVIEQVGTSH
jgi:hypothetical protein